MLPAGRHLICDAAAACQPRGGAVRSRRAVGQAGSRRGRRAGGRARSLRPRPRGSATVRLPAAHVLGAGKRRCGQQKFHCMSRTARRPPLPDTSTLGAWLRRQRRTLRAHARRSSAVLQGTHTTCTRGRLLAAEKWTLCA